MSYFPHESSFILQPCLPLCVLTAIKVTVFCKYCESWFNCLRISELYNLCVCVLFQSEEDFLEESDFDDISIHSASVLSDALGAATKKKARRGRKQRKSMFTVYTRHALWCVSFPSKIPLNFLKIRLIDYNKEQGNKGN